MSREKIRTKPPNPEIGLALSANPKKPPAKPSVNSLSNRSRIEAMSTAQSASIPTDTEVAFSDPVISNTTLQLPELRSSPDPYDPKSITYFMTTPPDVNVVQDLEHPRGVLIPREEHRFTRKDLYGTGKIIEVNGKRIPVVYHAEAGVESNLDNKIRNAMNIIGRGLKIRGDKLEHGYQRHASHEKNAKTLIKGAAHVPVTKFAVNLNRDEYLAEIKHAVRKPVAIIINPHKESISFIGLTTDPARLGSNYINIGFDNERGFLSAYPIGEGNYPTMALAVMKPGGGFKRDDSGRIVTLGEDIPKDLDTRPTLVSPDGQYWKV